MLPIACIIKCMYNDGVKAGSRGEHLYIQRDKWYIVLAIQYVKISNSFKLLILKVY